MEGRIIEVLLYMHAYTVLILSNYIKRSSYINLWIKGVFKFKRIVTHFCKTRYTHGTLTRYTHQSNLIYRRFFHKRHQKLTLRVNSSLFTVRSNKHQPSFVLHALSLLHTLSHYWRISKSSLKSSLNRTTAPRTDNCSIF